MLLRVWGGRFIRYDFLNVFSNVFSFFSLLILITSCQGGGSNKATRSSTIVELACTTYALPNRNVANASNFIVADKIKSNCTIVLDWFRAVPANSWCVYLRSGTQGVQYCGPYDNWGFVNTTNNKDAWIVTADIFNDYIIKSHPEWVLKDTDGAKVFNPYVPAENLVDHGNPNFIDFYFNYFIQVPPSIAGGRWQGTYTDKGWNMRFLDNFNVYAPWMWSSMPVNPVTRKPFTQTEREQDILNATQRMRERADREAGGLKYFANIRNDIELNYFNREIYPQLMQYLDYALFETWTSNLDGEPESETIWLRRVLEAQDMIQNRTAEPVVNTGIGDFWYALSTLLLVRENGRGMAWTETMLSDGLLQKLKDFDLGEPLGVFAFLDNAYQREWQKGKVIVNSADSQTVTISLSQNYEDVVTGDILSSITLPPKTGKILIAR